MFKDKSDDRGALPHSTAETVIGTTVKLEGDFASEGDIVIEGSVTGTVKTSGNLRVGEQAEIRAAVGAANAIIAGTVVGNLTVANRLELGPRARITGDIDTVILVTAEGALINGHIKMPNADSQSLSVTPQDSPAEPLKSTRL